MKNTGPNFNRREALAVTAGFAAIVVAPPAFAQEKPKAAPPVLVTSIGQSLDAFQVQLAVKRAGIPFEYDAHAEPDALASVKTAFLCVGASLKGFGDAGITIKEELARTTHILDEAKKRNIYIVVLHMGGDERRDALSNQLIELSAPRAHRLIIRNDSDADGIFAKIAKENSIPLTVIETVVELRDPLKEMFSGA